VFSVVLRPINTLIGFGSNYCFQVTCYDGHYEKETAMSQTARVSVSGGGKTEVPLQQT